MKQGKPESVNEYIADFPNEVQNILEKVRSTISKAAPQAKEKISYSMPAFYLNGNLVYFAAWKKHLGFYPTSGAIRKFKQELSGYAGANGSVQFPFDKPIPFNLISKIVKFRLNENLRKAEIKKKKK